MIVPGVSVTKLISTPVLAFAIMEIVKLYKFLVLLLSLS